MLYNATKFYLHTYTSFIRLKENENIFKQVNLMCILVYIYTGTSSNMQCYYCSQHDTNMSKPYDHFVYLINISNTNCNCIHDVYHLASIFQFHSLKADMQDALNI